MEYSHVSEIIKTAMPARKDSRWSWIAANERDLIRQINFQTCSDISFSNSRVLRFVLRTEIAPRALPVCPSSFFFFFVTRRTQLELAFCLAMISRTELQKTLVPTRYQSIKTLVVPFLVESSFRCFVSLREVRKNSDMRCFSMHWTIEIIKIELARKASR